MRKIKVVVLLVQQLQHGFTKNAKVSPNLTVAHIGLSYQIRIANVCPNSTVSNFAAIVCALCQMNFQSLVLI